MALHATIILKDTLEKNVKETGQDIFQSRFGLSKNLQYLKDSWGQPQFMCQSLVMDIWVRVYGNQCRLYTFIICL